MIPKWLEKYVKSEDLISIENSIKAAELKTDCEIVPMVVKRSSTIGHTFIILFFFLMLIYYIARADRYLSGNYENYWIFEIIWITVSFIVAGFLAKFPLLQRLSMPNQDLESQTLARAMNEFYHHKLDSTKSSNAVLLFISLQDRKAIVLVDKNISEPLPSETWDDVVNILLVGAKNKDLGSAFVNAIAKCATTLSKNFPIKINNTNELSNKLIIKD